MQWACRSIGKRGCSRAQATDRWVATPPSSVGLRAAFSPVAAPASLATARCQLPPPARRPTRQANEHWLPFGRLLSRRVQCLHAPNTKPNQWRGAKAWRLPNWRIQSAMLQRRVITPLSFRHNVSFCRTDEPAQSSQQVVSAQCGQQQNPPGSPFSVSVVDDRREQARRPSSPASPCSFSARPCVPVLPDAAAFCRARHRLVLALLSARV